MHSETEPLFVAIVGIGTEGSIMAESIGRTIRAKVEHSDDLYECFTCSSTDMNDIDKMPVWERSVRLIFLVGSIDSAEMGDALCYSLKKAKMFESSEKSLVLPLVKIANNSYDHSAALKNVEIMTKEANSIYIVDENKQDIKYGNDMFDELVYKMINSFHAVSMTTFDYSDFYEMFKDGGKIVACKVRANENDEASKIIDAFHQLPEYTNIPYEKRNCLLVVDANDNEKALHTAMRVLRGIAYIDQDDGEDCVELSYGLQGRTDDCGKDGEIVATAFFITGKEI